LRGIKQFDGSDEADVALLDEIDEEDAATIVGARDRRNQAETRLDQSLPREVIVTLLQRLPEPTLFLGG
jgi:hypothetical protein